MNFRYLMIFAASLIFGCASPTVYESTSRDYLDCTEMLATDSSHPVWDQPEWVQEIETDICKQLIFEAEFEAAVKEREANRTKEAVQ